MFMGDSSSGSVPAAGGTNDVYRAEETTEGFGPTVERLDSVIRDHGFWAKVHLVCGLLALC